MLGFDENSVSNTYVHKDLKPASKDFIDNLDGPSSGLSQQPSNFKIENMASPSCIEMMEQ